MNPDHVKIGAAVAGVGTIAWVLSRRGQRRKLIRLLENSAAVQAALEEKTIFWQPQQRAGELILLSNSVSAEDAFASILASLIRISSRSNAISSESRSSSGPRPRLLIKVIAVDAREMA